MKDKNDVLENSKALKEISKGNNFSQMIQNFPKQEEKAEFERFL
jgi:hypothetical protein